MTSTIMSPTEYDNFHDANEPQDAPSLSLPRIETLETGDNYAQFEIEPLERGYGVTLGNALRRVLLSSLPGAAVTAVQIDGIRHEFSSMPHIREDVTEFILNLKKVRFKSFSDEPVHILLEAEGEGPVTAADIHPSDKVEIVNPTQRLATIDSSSGRLTAELVVQKGVGYHNISEAPEELPIGQIPVDGVFSPIRRANFTVEHTRVGQMTNYERLLLEVTTDGAITPESALTQAATMLTRFFSHIGSFGEGAAVSELGRAPLSTRALPSQEYELPIEDLQLSARAENSLKRSGITKVGQVIGMNMEDLLSIRNFGQKSLDELLDRLRMRKLVQESNEVSG
jgi:DNA-directed RNA polymerase subunit alpha